MYKGEFFVCLSKPRQMPLSKFNHRLNFALENQDIILLHIPVFWAILAQFTQL
jgi:hypothetical protein